MVYLVNLDLGPRTDHEIMHAKLSEIDQERFTRIDIRLLRTIDEEGLILSYCRDRLEQSLSAGRLAKLAVMGLAYEVHKGSWRLADNLESTLRATGRRGEIIATLDREVRARGPPRPRPTMPFMNPQLCSRSRSSDVSPLVAFRTSRAGGNI